MPMTADPLHLLDLAVRSHASGDPMPGEVREWIAQGLIAHIETGKPVGACLGLVNGMGNRYRRWLRDKHIRRACELMGGDMRKLSGRIEEFATDKWPVWQFSGLAGDADEIDVCLCAAFETGQKVPTSNKQLRRVCGDMTERVCVPGWGWVTTD